MTQRIWPIAAALAICFMLAASISSANAQGNNNRGALRSACQDDYQRLCAGVSPGGGRIKKCMSDNSALLSPKCKSALAGETQAK